MFSIDLRNKFERELDGIPGCSVAIVNRKGELWTEEFGWADIIDSKKNGPETVYHLFSGTKLYTATAVMQLIEAGKLHLETSAYEVLSEYEALKPVTIRHLLSHTSGLKESVSALLSVHTDSEESASAEEALKMFNVRSCRAPGKKASYCNTNYACLGVIIERLSGMAFGDYVRSHVLKPLGIKADFYYTDEMKERATGLMERWGLYRWLSYILFSKDTRRQLFGEAKGKWLSLRDYGLNTAAIGGLVGSAADFAPFLWSHLNEGKGLLTPESTQAMHQLQMKGRVGIESKEGVGLGWKIGKVGETPFLNHEGGGLGFTSETRLYPEEGLGIVLMMNVWGKRISHVAHRLCEHVRLSSSGEYGHSSILTCAGAE